MSALTIERKTLKLGQDAIPSFPTNQPLPIAASTKIYSGAMVYLATQGANAGNVVQGQAATGLVALGVAEQTYDNSSGAAGALTIVPRQGVFHMNVAGGADAIGASNVGQVCYCVDDNTVGLTSNGGARSPAGLVVAVDGGTPPFSQPTGVWVLLGVLPQASLSGAAPLASFQMPADAAASTVTAEEPFGYAKLPENASAVFYIPSSTVALAASTFATFTVGWRNGAGGSLQTLGTLSNQAAGFTAFQPNSFGALTNAAIPPGAVFTVSVAKASTGTQLPTGLLIVV